MVCRPGNDGRSNRRGRGKGDDPSLSAGLGANAESGLRPGGLLLKASGLAERLYYGMAHSSGDIEYD
jgi:hypothetical protein